MPRKRHWMKGSGLLLCVALTACGGSSDNSSPPAAVSTSATSPTTPSPPISSASPASVGPSQADASRFVDQATFGVTASDVAQVQSAGFDAYLDQQLTVAASQYTGFSYSPHTPPTTCRYDGVSTDASSICARDQYSSFQVQRQFFMHALTGADQLRQRVAFALSQIFVVSNIEIYEAYGMADYQNMLLRDAFANYRVLLQDVTLSPVMGHYLDMADNAKANPVAGTQPNENYGREVMQLDVHRAVPAEFRRLTAVGRKRSPDPDL